MNSAIQHRCIAQIVHAHSWGSLGGRYLVSGVCRGAERSRGSSAERASRHGRHVGYGRDASAFA